MIRTCPGFERYGINEDGEIMSSCRGNWVVLNASKGVICLRGEKITTCKIAKFRYCVEHQINPLKLNCVGAIITRDGKIMTRTDFLAMRNKYIHEAKVTILAEEKIKKIQRHIDFSQAAIEWLRGNPGKLIEITNMEREHICSLLWCNKEFAYSIVLEAELQLFKALDRGSVIDPFNWLIKRARGILAERKKTIMRFSDKNLAELKYTKDGK